MWLRQQRMTWTVIKRLQTEHAVSEVFKDFQLVVRMRLWKKIKHMVKCEMNIYSEINK